MMLTRRTFGLTSLGLAVSATLAVGKRCAPSFVKT